MFSVFLQGEYSEKNCLRQARRRAFRAVCGVAGAGSGGAWCRFSCEWCRFSRCLAQVQLRTVQVHGQAAQVPGVNGAGSAVNGAGSKTGAGPAPRIGLLCTSAGAGTLPKMEPAPFTSGSAAVLYGLLYIFFDGTKKC